MVQLPQATWFAIIAIAVAAVLGVLHIVSARVRDLTFAHNLKIETISLRLNQLVQLKAMSQYRDLSRLPDNMESKIRYLVEDIYPGDETSENPDETAPEPTTDHQLDEDAVDQGLAAAA